MCHGFENIDRAQSFAFRTATITKRSSGIAKLCECPCFQPKASVGFNPVFRPKIRLTKLVPELRSPIT